MPTQTLTPTAQVPDAAGLDLTALLATPTQTTLQFPNTGNEVLYVAAAAAAETVTVNIGALVDGQAVTQFSPTAVTNAHTVMFGPFRAVLDQSGTSTMQVTLSTTTAISVALVRNTAVI